MYRKGQNALKIPHLVWPVYDQDAKILQGYREDNDDNIRSIKDEKAAYQQLGEHPNIVRCIDISGPGIEMELIKGGDLAAHLEREHKPSLLVRGAWLLQIAKALKHSHRRLIFVGELDLRNFLVADDGSLKMVDFSHAKACTKKHVHEVSVSFVTNKGDLVDHDDTTQADIFAFGCVMYSIVTWSNYPSRLRGPYRPSTDTRPVEQWRNENPGFGVNRDLYWPNRSLLPETNMMPCGQIIDDCWKRGKYANMEKVLEYLTVTLRYSCPSLFDITRNAPQSKGRSTTTEDDNKQH